MDRSVLRRIFQLRSFAQYSWSRIQVHRDEKGRLPRLKELPLLARKALTSWARVSSQYVETYPTPEQLKSRLNSFLSDSASRLVFPQSQDPVVSILIPTFNKAEYLYQCLESILEYTEAAFEVIVIDDGSNDATTDLMAKVINVQAIRNETNAGFIRSCNRGAGVAVGRYVLFLNNDVVVTPEWLSPLIETAECYPQCGAVGGKLVRPDGSLQEAGSIIWQDGSALGYGRDDDPSKPEYCYLREVDYVSGAYLLVRADLFRKLGSFDEIYLPAYYEDADLCLGIRELGYKVVYQPQAMIVHYEYGSHSKERAVALCGENQSKFKRKWAKELSHNSSYGDLLRARDRRTGKRVLVIDDQIPAPYLGSGLARAYKLQEFLSQLGCIVTFIPANVRIPWLPTTQKLQQMGVETFYGNGFNPKVLLLSRSGFYDVVIVSRPHNGERFLNVARKAFPKARVIYDAEAIFAKREILRAELEGRGFSEEEKSGLFRKEFNIMGAADVIVTVSEEERQLILADAPHGDVAVWGFTHELHKPTTAFSDRRDLLFVGGFMSGHPPNIDGVRHFANELFPKVLKELPDARFVIVGSQPPDVILKLASDQIVVTGFVEDLTEYYEKCRIFIAPIRFGAGINYKLTEAMSYGIPSVISSFTALGLNVSDGREVLIANDDAEFIAKTVRLYQDESLWYSVQRAAQDFIGQHCSAETMKRKLEDILNG